MLPPMLDVVALTDALCRIPSITGDEAALVADVEKHLLALGMRVQRQQVGDTPGRDNLLATVGDHTPTILLSTHTDTVPPFLPPHNDGEWMWGRGVCDAKGIVAAMLCALERLLADGETRVGALFVVGEETNSDGAKAAAQGFAPHVKYIVNGEPTDGLLVKAMKGVLAFELDVEGKAAHSAYPHAGHSATHQLLDDLHALRNEAWHVDTELGPTTLNVGVLAGGVAPNVLAPHASAKIVMRTTSDADVVEQRVRALLSSTTRIDVKTKSSPQHLHAPEGEASCVVAFGSDVPHLTPLVTAQNGAPLLVGPGSILDAHTSHERVKISDLHASVDTYVRLCRLLLV
jgi:acetylornithine deacetylase